MKVQVLSLKAAQDLKTFDVAVLIGTELYEFQIAIDLDKIAGREIQIINGDENFSEIFRFNQRVANNICKLVSKVYNHQAFELPAEIGEFYSDKIESARV